MKPADHPDFYRFAPPPGTSRESTIVLDREGRFTHDGDPIDHAALEKGLRTWISRHPDDGRYILTNGYDWTYFKVEGTPFFVDALRIEPGVEPEGSVTLVLFDGTEERLDPSTLSVDAEGVMQAIVKPARLPARFSRHAQTQLAPLLVSAEPPVLRLGGREVAIPPTPSPLPS